MSYLDSHGLETLWTKIKTLVNTKYTKPSGGIPASDLAQTYLTDAPSDNKQYARKNGAWSEVSGGTAVEEYTAAEVETLWNSLS